MIRNKIWLHSLLLNFLLICSTAYAMTTTVDKTTVELGDTIRVTYTLEANKAKPNLEPLNRDFTIQGSERSQELSVIDGKISQRMRWVFTLIPKRTGNLTLPALTFGDDTSKGYVIFVKKRTAPYPSQTQRKNFMLKHSVNKTTPYQNQPIGYTVRFYYSAPIADVKLLPPQAKGIDIRILDRDRRFYENVDGRNYHVIERQYQIIPKKTGKITLQGARLTGINQALDPFAVAAMTPVDKVKLSTKPVTLHVQAIPQASLHPLPLVAKKVNLEQQWSTNLTDINVGDPITRTVQLTVVNADPNRIPNLAFESSPGLNNYPDKPQREQFMQNGDEVTQITVKVAYIATKPGPLRIAKTNVEWFNTQEGSWQTTTLPAVTLHVAGAVPVKPDIPKAELPIQREEKKADTNTLPLNTSASLWQALSGLFGGLWLITLVWGFRRGRKTHKKKKDLPPFYP